MGDDVSQMIERISARAGARVDIYRWRDVYRSIQYKKIISAVRDQYLGDIKFSAKVRSEVVSNLGKRFADVQDSSEQMLKRKLYRLDSYVLHEIAGLIVMSEYFGFPTEVYPGEDVKILRSIYKGEFPSLENIIPKKRVRSFCELNFE